MKTMLLFPCLVFLHSDVSEAMVHNVPADYSKIQTAMEVAVSGDTILVAPGVYNELVNFLGKDVVLESAAGALSTTIDCNGLNMRPITIDSGEGEGAVLDGFTLQNGVSYPSPGETFGGGILISNSSPVIKNCVITDCQSGFAGGAIGIIENSSPLVISNHISSNYADNGPFGFGGGIYLSNSTASIQGNTITGNTAEDGSAICLVNDSSVISNNLIVNNPNTFLDPKGTLSFGGSCNTLLCNNTIADNQVQALWGTGNSVEVANCIIWGNGSEQISGTFNVFFSDIESGYIGTGNISDTPCFISGSLSEYHLDPNSSPCIDTGDSNPLFNDLEDPSNPGFALWPALGGLRNDMGVYGGNGISYWLGISAEESQDYPNDMNFSVSPNPFTSSLSIYCNLRGTSPVTISLYDTSGRLVDNIAEELLISGENILTWVPNNSITHGCYFVVLCYDDTRVAETVILIR